MLLAAATARPSVAAAPVMRAFVPRSGGQTRRHNDFVDDLDERDRDDDEELQRRDRESDDEYGHNDGKDDRQEHSTRGASPSSNRTRPNGDHYVYALTDYREVDRSIALARL